jgi:hypothetical protein
MVAETLEGLMTTEGARSLETAVTVEGQEEVDNPETVEIVDIALVGVVEMETVVTATTGVLEIREKPVVTIATPSLEGQRRIERQILQKRILLWERTTERV